MGSSSTDGDAAVTAPATPRTDALHFNWKGDIDMQRHELLKLSRTLETELTERTEQLAHYKKMHDLGWAKQDCPCCGAQMAGNDAYQAWQKRAEKADAENAALKALLKRCRPRIEYLAYPEGSEESILLTEINAAVAKGKA